MKRLSFLFICLSVAITSQAGIITVDDDGPADFNNIQAAIDDANDGDVIIVKPGTYTGNGNRDIDFLGKAITVQSTEPDNPNIVAATIIDCNGNQAEPHRGFYFHSGEDPNSLLAGLTVTKGYAPAAGPYFSPGGGIYCVQSSPVISKCVITSNSASSGGGVCCYSGSSPTITDCTISNNTAANNGGMLVTTEGSPIFINCVFIGNRAENSSGGIGTSSSNLVLLNCKFINNSTLGCGGGIGEDWWSSKMTLINCLFWGNSAGSKGGAIWTWLWANATIINCTFYGNTAEFGGAIEHDEGANIYIINSILWSDNATYGSEIGMGYDDWIPTLFIDFTDLQGGPTDKSVLMGPDSYYGLNNKDTDPCFADTNNGDFHLKSQAGRWDANEGRWTKDEETSLCIDAGDPSSPIGFEPFPNGGIINMGAYGGTEEASKSYFGEPVCETIVAGDINGDCKVDFKDFALMALHWLEDNN